MKIITFGRHTNNEIVINDPKVSRIHLQIIQDDNNNFTLVDLNSVNGTFVNGQRVTGEVALNPNDTVRIGNTAIVWQDYFLQQADTPVNPVETPVKLSKASAYLSGTPANPADKPKLYRKTWFIAAAIIVALLLIGGGAAFYFVDKANNERIEAEAKRKAEEAHALADEKRQEAELRKVEKTAIDARIAAEEAAKKAAQTQSKKDKEKARELQANYESKQKEVAAKATELSNANQKVKNLENDKKNLESQNENLQRSVKEQEEAQELLKKEALEKEQRAQQEAKNAKKSVDLTAEFSEKLLEFSEKDCKKVCTSLAFQNPTGKDYKKTLLQHFNKADNTGKGKILKAVTAETNAAKNKAKELEKTFDAKIKSVSDPQKKSFKQRFDDADNEGKQSIIDEIATIQTQHDTIKQKK
ncbi:MAG: FHA domain-containing protein [Prevotellaceae bacterium]|jgi:pSer/pThr/pTyr-binding forkhead associated (FHA) protein|nr:FHA domain-containing protein [Prevotellaceae bacterium]